MNYSDLVVYVIVGLTLAVIGGGCWQFLVVSYADILRERMVDEHVDHAALTNAVPRPEPNRK